MLVVFISGNGTNLQALIDAGIRISLVVSNIPHAHGLVRAADNNIPTLIHSSKLASDKSLTREEYDRQLSDLVIERVGIPGLIVFAGFMRIVVGFLLGRSNQQSSVFLEAFKNTRIINLHPALPNGVKGLNALRIGFDLFQQSNGKDDTLKLGVMIHEVVEAVDEGRCLMSAEVKCIVGESYETFENRARHAELLLIVDTVRRILAKTL